MKRIFKMDLNSFIETSKERENYKVTYALGNQKIKRFVSGYSKENARHLVEHDLKTEYPGKKIIISEVKLIPKRREEDENGSTEAQDKEQS